MDLSTVLQLMGQRRCGLSVQTMALDIQRLYHLGRSAESAGIRLLAILTPGDLAENNAVEFWPRDRTSRSTCCMWRPRRRYRQPCRTTTWPWSRFAKPTGIAAF